jgi:hypothetical protein
VICRTSKYAAERLPGCQRVWAVTEVAHLCCWFEAEPPEERRSQIVRALDPAA